MQFKPTHEYERYTEYLRSLRHAGDNPKTRIYTAAVFSFLAISLFGWYAIRPTLATILFLRKEIADKTITNTQMEEKITSLIEAQAAYQESADRVRFLDDAMPPHTNIISLVRQLKTITDQSGASLSGIRVPSIPLQELGNSAVVDTSEESLGQDTSKKQKKLIEFPVSLIASGSYGQLKAILDTLLTMRRIMSFQRITFSQIQKESNKAASGSGLLQMEVRGTSYFYE